MTIEYADDDNDDNDDDDAAAAAADDDDDVGTCNAGSCEFRCANGRCVFHDWRCDGYNDCFDNSDELNCSELHFLLSNMSHVYFTVGLLHLNCAVCL